VNCISGESANGDPTIPREMTDQSSDGGLSWSRPQSIAVSDSDSESDNAFVVSDGSSLYVSWHNRLQGYRIFLNLIL
jgi:hypothetical protein